MPVAASDKNITKSEVTDFAGTPTGTEEFCAKYWESSFIHEISEAIPLANLFLTIRARGIMLISLARAYSQNLIIFCV